MALVATIVTDGVVGAFTVMLTALLVAVLVEMQDALDVRTHETLCPLVIDAVVKVALVAPVTLVPLILH